MQSETDIRALHARIANVLRFAKSIRLPMRELRELIAVKVQLEYILDMHTASANEWSVMVHKAIQNLEGLQKTHERSVKAFNN